MQKLTITDEVTGLYRVGRNYCWPWEKGDIVTCPVCAESLYVINKDCIWHGSVDMDCITPINESMPIMTYHINTPKCYTCQSRLWYSDLVTCRGGRRRVFHHAD